MTTDAGPQLFSDCHTCFISLNAAVAGAAFGSGAGMATATTSAAGAVTAIGAASDAPSSTFGTATASMGVEKDGAAATAAPLRPRTNTAPSVRRAAGRRLIGRNGRSEEHTSELQSQSNLV